jgi:cellulose synthase/poly-beta-1,6-N-acetylglucosamine synthase-like glycosyltransferase
MLLDPPPSYFPKVSILVAARNEADTILRCLESLERLRYPKEKMEVLIGNDQSTDDTAAIARQYGQGKSWIKLFDISPSSIQLAGKTNVLAQLAHEARGEYLFFCDADIAVHPDWINQMLAHFGEGVGVVVGVTRMTPSGLFAGMQSLEWLLSQSAMRFFSLRNIPFTGMGNNMAVPKAAYHRVGGYEKIGFSIVEDYALFMALIQAGYSFVQGFNAKILSVSLPVRTLPELLLQRKRWVSGAMAAPWLIRLSFYGSALMLPLILLVMFVAPGWALALTGVHYGVVTLIGYISIRILKQQDLLKYLPLFWFYFNINNLVMLVNYLLPTPTIWKGRHYPQ